MAQVIPYRERPIHRYVDRSLVPAVGVAAGLGTVYNVAQAAYKGYKVAKPVVVAVKKKVVGKTKLPRTKFAATYSLRVSNPIPHKKSLRKQVKDIRKELNKNTGNLIYHQSMLARLLSSVSQMNQGGWHDVSCPSMETVLGQLRFFNPSDPTTLIQGSGVTGTYARDYLFKSIYMNYEVKNNYQVPAEVTIYCVQVREDTSIVPITAFTQGLTDVGNPSSTSPYVHITDSKQFTDLWKIVKSTKKVLQPGASLELSHSVKDIGYDPSLTDSHADTYQRRYKHFGMFVRVQGVLGHDTTANEQGLLEAGIDIHAKSKYIVSYDAGVDLTFIYINSGLDTFTNGGVVSSKPVADNIGYSIA